MRDDQIKYMTERFLRWRLPENFNPDGGISFKKTFNETTAHPMKHEPVGTNLFDVTQAEGMVRYMAEGMPFVPNPKGDTMQAHQERVVIDSFIIRAFIYWVSITFLLLAAASTAHCQNPQYRQPFWPWMQQIFVDHAQNAIVRELSSGGGTTTASGEGCASIPTPVEESLGDAARRLRAQRDGQPKAKIQYVN